MKNFFVTTKIGINIEGKNFNIFKSGIYADEEDTFHSASFFSLNNNENWELTKEIFISYLSALTSPSGKISIYFWLSNREDGEEPLIFSIFKFLLK